MDLVTAARFSEKKENMGESIYTHSKNKTLNKTLVISASNPEYLKCGQITIPADNHRGSVIRQSHWGNGVCVWWKQFYFGRVGAWPALFLRWQSEMCCVGKCSHTLSHSHNFLSLHRPFLFGFGGIFNYIWGPLAYCSGSFLLMPQEPCDGTWDFSMQGMYST